MRTRYTWSAVWLVPLVLLTAAHASGGVIHVPSDYPSIKKAISVSSESDTILVAPGEYTGPANRSIDVDGRSFILKSEAGPAKTVIDAQGFSYIFRLSDVPASALLEGFTLSGGAYIYGGAVFCHGNVALAMRNCVFSSPSAASNRWTRKRCSDRLHLGQRWLGASETAGLDGDRLCPDEQFDPC